MNCLHYFTITASIFLFTPGYVQAQQKVNARTYNRFLAEYSANSDTNHKVKMFRRDTMVHPFALVSREIIQQNVYVNEDIVRLVQELNPKIDMNDSTKIISADAMLIFPIFPPVRQAVLDSFRIQYSKDSLPDKILNNEFQFEINNFNLLFTKLPVQNEGPEKPFYDSLSVLKNRILPHLDENAPNISRLQMKYLVKELAQLNQTFAAKKARSVAGVYRPTGNFYSKTHTLASYIVADFYQITRPVIIRKFNRYSGGSSGSNLCKAQDKKFIFFYDNSWTPFACNLYIYGKDEQEKRKKEPEMESFTVWLGDKMSFMGRQKDSDPTTYGFTRMGNKASTLPFNIGLGNWVVVMKKNGVGKEYYKEISIKTETEFDPNDPSTRKVCFILE